MKKKAMFKKIGNIAVIGAGGYMGKFYINSLINLGVDPKSIVGVETNAYNLQDIANLHPEICLTDNMQNALSFYPNVALIMVNSPLHKLVIEQCYKAGVRKFFVEKPLVYTVEQLTPLNELNLKNLYTGYLINFSGIVKDLFNFMRERNLELIQARSFWGKNWCSVNRPMGGDAEEEMPHPLALILSTIEQNQDIKHIKPFIRLTYVPYINSMVTKKINMKELGFPEKLNDSSVADFIIKTNKRNINSHIMTSFNLYEQIRRVEMIFVEEDNVSNFPKFKACLEFDVGGKDILRIKDALNDEEILISEFKGDKMQIQLNCVLKAFTEENADTRLIGFKQAAWLVHLIEESAEI